MVNIRWLSRKAASVLLALSMLVPLAAGSSAHAAPQTCMKSAPVAGTTSIIRVPGPGQKKLLNHNLALLGGSFIVIPATPTCIFGPFTCPSHAICWVAPDTNGAYGHAESTSGGAGLLVQFQTRVTGAGPSAWDTVVQYSCRVGGELSKNQQCSVQPNAGFGFSPGYDARVICSWRDQWQAVDRNATVDCNAEPISFPGS